MWAAAGSLVPDMLVRPQTGRPAAPPARTIIPRRRARIVAAAAPEVESKGRKGKRAANKAQAGNAYAGPSRPKRGGTAPRKVDEDEDETSGDDGAYDDDTEEGGQQEEVAGTTSAASSAANDQKLERTSSRLAVAAKISAARALARKLADEKAAAAAAAKLGGGAVNTAVEAIKKSAEAASAFAAQEVARADTMARAAKRAEVNAQQMIEYQKLKAENEALQQLVLEVANDKAIAQNKLSQLRERFKNFIQGSQAATAQPPTATTKEAPPKPSPPPSAPTPPQAIPRPAPQPTKGEERPIIPFLPFQPPRMTQSGGPAAPPQTPEQLRQKETAAAEEAAWKEEEAKEKSLQVLAATALQDKEAFFTTPQAGAAPGTRIRVYYNRVQGPLPHGSHPWLKVGYNKWEQIVETKMRRCSDLANSNDAEWWEGDLALPKQLFKVDFVVMDKTGTGVVDNNMGQDFQVSLVNAPTESEIILRLSQQYEDWEDAMVQKQEAQEDALMETALEAASEEADKARQRFRIRQENTLLQEAMDVVSQRRTPELEKLPMATSKQGTYIWLGGEPQAGQQVQLLYNRNNGNLRHSQSVSVHVGYDGWWMMDKRVYKMSKLSNEEARSLSQQHNFNLENGEWWRVSVNVPNTASVLNFVFSDEREEVWESANGKDFHTRVAGAPTSQQLAELLMATLKAQRETPEAEEEERHREEMAAENANFKLALKAKALRMRRDLQRKFLFTEPMIPRAGEKVTVYYNPDNTVLRGRPDIWVRGSWNRWDQDRAWDPILMQPVVEGASFGFLKATVTCPPDAHTLDVVFSDSGEITGGFYDNNKGLDYHIPVEGGSGATSKSLHVVHVTVEMAPIAKVGGLGDVVTALGRAVQDEGHQVHVILPKYDCINYDEVENLTWANDFNWAGTSIKVWKGFVEGLETVFLEPLNGIFWVGCIYGRNDDAGRFTFFCNAALEYLRNVSGWKPDIVHCHDWQTAPVAYGQVGDARPVLTIHNMNYGADLIGRAMAACSVATTVSPTYAAEISGHPAIAPNLDKLYGIRNGIDMDIWDPMEDDLLPRLFSSGDVVQGKAAAKAELRRRANLCQADVPLVSVVTRLTHQKGIHLIKHAAWRTLERGGQFVLLGSAPDGRVQGEFNALAAELGRQYPDRARLIFAYDEPLSHLIYAGSDMFLVPSMFEPCGLTQLIAMRYGAIPIVRRTGGLNDTVFDVDTDEERARSLGYDVNGFSFEGSDAAGMDYALNRALAYWYTDKEWWQRLSRKVMEQDWSWNLPSLDYIELYHKALKGF